MTLRNSFRAWPVRQERRVAVAGLAAAAVSFSGIVLVTVSPWRTVSSSGTVTSPAAGGTSTGAAASSAGGAVAPTPGATPSEGPSQSEGPSAGPPGVQGQSATSAVTAAFTDPGPLPTIADRPAGRIVLHAYAAGGRALTLAQFRAIQAGGSVGADGSGVDDMLLDSRTLRVVRPWPLYGSGAQLTLDRPAGALALTLSWPSSAGCSAAVIDLPGPGSYVFNQLIARQAVADLDYALRARTGYTASPGVTGLAGTARAELAAADAAPSETEKARHADVSYEAAVAAQLKLLREYGPWYAKTQAHGRFTWGVTVDDPDHAGAALRAAKAMAAAGTGPVAVRLVFDERAAPQHYAGVVASAHGLGLRVVGQFLDSSQMPSLSLEQWKKRVQAYTAALPSVDVWEVGNEVNGNFLGGQVPEKVAYAAAWVKGHTKARTMVTLLWQLGQDDAPHSVFTWAGKNLGAATLSRIDEIGLSVYPENAPLGAGLDRVLRTLHAAYPKQQLSITELGYGSPDLDRRWWWGSRADWTGGGRSAVADWYGRALLGYPYAGGGTYWWYFRTEAVQGNALWRTLSGVSKAAASGR